MGEIIGNFLSENAAALTAGAGAAAFGCGMNMEQNDGLKEDIGVSLIFGGTIIGIFGSHGVATGEWFESGAPDSSAAAIIKEWKKPDQTVAFDTQNLHLKRGDQYISPHLSRNAKLYAQLPPIRRAMKMRMDFIDMVENTRSSEEHRQMPIIGVSHLARVFEHTDVPTKKITGLTTKITSKIRSQITSNLFGGARKIKSEDITVFMIPPEKVVDRKLNLV